MIIPLLLKPNELSFKTNQYTTLNEIQISIKIDVIQFSKRCEEFSKNQGFN